MSSLMTDQRKQDVIPKVFPLPQTTLNIKFISNDFHYSYCETIIKTAYAQKSKK